ncbi:alpha/beta hydrolase [Pseudonocardia sulfidoxydans NBRC 16205]|uniref:Alpha/beta hydrolase n=1 Tax=Pseudonocardia sulfidoxydans NBRC 16205 TaxID=1223511 RepID=A0A511DC62_9PSEU|nr:alpha/beta hydrolase [Pseudonocardia sulfidoxydans]GEL22390.1 alpha/beta hydrolase [Pseudonocardia sulfidoxydans NBRC 16205]
MNATRAPEYTSSIAETSLGPVEYAVVGTGAPVVVLHGSPGGIDAAALMARMLPRDRISAILLSRPGYLGTDLAGRTTIDEQADLVAALLDHLGIERAGVYTWSGGGPAGYRFAVRHPGRVTALVANAAVSRAYELPHQDLPTRLLFTTAPGQWLMRLLAAHQPQQFVQGTLSSEGDLGPEELTARVEQVFADPDARQFVLDLGPASMPDKVRRAGFRNDLDRFAEITSLELGRITAPTLVVQGTADADLPPAHSTFAAAAVPGAELLTLDRGTHLALYIHPDAAAAQARVVDFLLRR